MKKEFLKTQTDYRWKDVEMTAGLKIGGAGCLLTSCSNIFCDFFNIPDMTPRFLDDFLDKNKGYTPEGYIIWSILENKFKFKHYKYNNFIPDFRVGRYFIVQVPFKNTGHFCNVLSENNNAITYFDVFDGQEKRIELNKTVSIRGIYFQ